MSDCYVMTEMDEEMMLVCIVWSNFLALTSSFEKVTTLLYYNLPMTGWQSSVLIYD